MEKVDCFIPCCVKDQTKLTASIRSLVENLKECGDIYVSMPDCGNFPDYEIDGHKVTFHNDFDVLPIQGAMPLCSFRRGWILQQLLKLLQPLTKTPYWFVFDADCILLRKTSLFEDGKPKLYEQPNPSDEGAFHRFISRMSGGELCLWTDEHKCKTTYIADHGLFSRQWVAEMVNRYFPTGNAFVEFVCMNTFWQREEIHRSMFISEYELYGLFLERFHRDEVVLSRMKKKQLDRWQDFQEEAPKFTEEDVKKEIEAARAEDFDILKLQTNCPRSAKNYVTGGLLK